MVHDKSIPSRLFTLINYGLLTMVALLCMIPLIHILAVSFSSRAPAIGGFVTFWPIQFTVLSYEKVLKTGAFLTGLQVSVMRTVFGTALMMLVTILTAYPLSRPAKMFRGRKVFTWMLIFAMIFNGGLIPFYLVVRYLGLIDKIWALVLPFGLPIFNIVLLINFFRDVPSELDDAAVIDGASHWQLLYSVYLPLSLPALATLALFCAVFHWNEFFFGMIFMTTNKNLPLQSYLRQVVILNDISTLIGDPSAFAKFSDKSLRAATIFITTIPILLVYPFVQRYFVTGTRLGSIKG